MSNKKLQVAAGIKENGIVVGNAYDKYGSHNPIVRWLMNGFNVTLSKLVEKCEPQTIHEVGCGEGFWVINWIQKGIKAQGSDFSEKVITIARQNAEEEGCEAAVFKTKSIYDIEPISDSADLIVCCEVLEHVEEPERALLALQKVVDKNLIMSVPREPLWRLLNMARGKYLAEFGNTPGHIQHWSSGAFTRMVSDYFNIKEVHTPLPWIMILCKPK